MRIRLAGLGLMLFAYISPLVGQESVDAAMMQKIRQEGLERSQVMDIAFQLTDVAGPRLTNSPGYQRAADYAIRFLTQKGLKNARLDPWGEFGKGWELKKSYVAMTAPYYKPLQAWPKTWTRGTRGLQRASVMLVKNMDSATVAGMKDRLKGALVLLDTVYAYRHSFKPDATRYTEEDLEKMASAKPSQAPSRPRNLDTAAQRRRMEEFRRRSQQLAAVRNLLQQSGAVGMLSTSMRNHDGTIFAQGGGAYKLTDPENMLDIAIGLEDYNSLVRMSRLGIPVSLELDVQTTFYDQKAESYNVLAEIPGTDPRLKEEVVMLGGHLDSWQAGTGATDNAAGCAVMMEAVRILQALGVKPKRTIRIALWSGEEQGLLGSNGYVRKTFLDGATEKPNAAHEKFSAYYNIDNGTGRIRGIYLQGNEACRSIFQSWLAPFADLGATTVTINNTGGTDHQAFDRVGLPGFQFIQDDIEYDTRTHHSNMDTYDHLVADDLKQMATIVAAFVYNTAQREEKLPRK